MFMSNRRNQGFYSRRDVLLGAAMTSVAAGGIAGEAVQSPTTLARRAPQFDLDRFIEDCKQASQGSKDAQSAVRDVFARVISNPKSVLQRLGAPEKGGLRTLYRSTDLTILNIVWSPLMQLVPHEHNMWSLIGIYTGREDNIFWQRKDGELAATSASAISQGSVVPLPRDVIHSVANPTEKLTGAIHIYGGDFFAVARSEWDPETLQERNWDIQRAVRIFQESNDRFFDWQKRKSCS
jgi:predicted metal-dependent enzyme (double-stranded beta helix superfamily)